jgi:hypothetical protein
MAKREPKEIIIEGQTKVDHFWNSKKEKAKIGSSIEGKIIAIEKGDYGLQAIIEDAKGKTYMTPAHYGMQQFMDHVKEGQSIKVTLTGTYKGKKGLGYNYKVFLL